MAAIAVRVLTSGGPISKFVCNVFLYMCAKFGAFITKRTIVLVCSLTICLHTEIGGSQAEPFLGTGYIAPLFNKGVLVEGTLMLILLVTGSDWAWIFCGSALSSTKGVGMPWVIQSSLFWYGNDLPKMLVLLMAS